MTRDKLSKTGERAEKREFYKELFGLAIPIGLQSLLVALIGASDALMLGRWLLHALADHGPPRLGCNSGGIHMALLCILGPIVAEFFVLTETAKQYLIAMLIFSASYVFAYSINTIIVCGVFPAGGDAKYDAVSVFFASWCFSLPLALLGDIRFPLARHGGVHTDVCG